MADSSLPQVDIRLYHESFGVHGRFHLFYVKDEYLTFSMLTNDKLTLILDGATSSVEPNLQDVFDIPLFTRMAESHVFNAFDWVCRVVSCLDLVGPLRLSHNLELLFMAHHVAGSSQVNKPHVFDFKVLADITFTL